MNNSFRAAMTSIIADAKSLSKDELQAKFDAFEAGPVGKAILENTVFFEESNSSRKYEISMMKIISYMPSKVFTPREAITPKETMDTPSNDDCYQMAA